MRLPRKEAVVDVMDDGKIYVIGGCSGKYSAENYGEVYDPNTQTWEPISATTLDQSQSHQPTNFHNPSQKSKRLLQFSYLLHVHTLFKFHQVVRGRDRVVDGGSRW
ncbi:Kelch repeat type 1 protein [Raphanus sativus]|nr:Kelch repeat type 1 protein [Raphanus sativus]